MMLNLIAWRNIWRNKVRSLVVMTSIGLGIWAGIFMMAFSWGMSEQYVNTAIEGQISHLQIHTPEYKANKEVDEAIPDAASLLKEINAMPEVHMAAGRAIVNGMASSPVTGTGVSIKGVDPQNEDSLTHLSHDLIDGDYFRSIRQNPVLIGEKLAEKLDVKVRNKIVLTFQSADGNITAGAFRITGIFKTRNSSFDETNVFVNQYDLSRLLGLPEATHEIAILLNDNDQLTEIQSQLENKFPGLLIENWREIAPELGVVIDSFSQYMYLFIAIILLALMFGIINTMLMAVLERVHELGMLMAIGMNKTKVFFMIMLETAYLSLVGGPLGILLAYGTVYYFGEKGINLSMFSVGLEAYGMDPMVYPSLESNYYLDIMVMVIIAAILAAIYPSFKALKLKPATAIRKI